MINQIFEFTDNMTFTTTRPVNKLTAGTILAGKAYGDSPEEAVNNLQQSMEDLLDEMYLVEEFI